MMDKKPVRKPVNKTPKTSLRKKIVERRKNFTRHIVADLVEEAKKQKDPIRFLLSKGLSPRLLMRIFGYNPKDLTKLSNIGESVKDDRFKVLFENGSTVGEYIESVYIKLKVKAGGIRDLVARGFLDRLVKEKYIKELIDAGLFGLLVVKGYAKEMVEQGFTSEFIERGYTQNQINQLIAKSKKRI